LCDGFLFFGFSFEKMLPFFLLIEITEKQDVQNSTAADGKVLHGAF
jgi:hypothetical protein